MKWILALLVSAGMFYTGYHHASRYVEEPDAEPDAEPAEANPKPPKQEPPPTTVTPAPPIAETVAPAPTPPEGDAPSVTPAPDVAPDADPDRQADPLAGTEGTALNPRTQLAKFYREAGEGARADTLERNLARVREELKGPKS